MIKIENMSFRYGKDSVIENMNLELTKPGIYSLLGPNGAGKTTLLKLIKGVLTPVSGQIDLQSNNVNFVSPESGQFNMRVWQILELANSVQDNFDIDFAKKVVKDFSIDINKKYKKLSLGNKALLATTLSLSNNSPIVLLDEPMLGADPINREEFSDLLEASFNKLPRVILVSTHLIDEIARVTNDILILNKGEILVNENMASLQENIYCITGPTQKVNEIISKNSLNRIYNETLGAVTKATIFGKRETAQKEVENYNSIGSDIANTITIENISLREFFVRIIGSKKLEK